MDKTGNRQEHTASRNERLSRDEIAPAQNVVTTATRGYANVYSLTMPIMPLIVNRANVAHPQGQVETYQAVNDGRQHQFAPYVGSAAMEPQPNEAHPDVTVSQYEYASVPPAERAYPEVQEVGMNSGSIDIAAQEQPYQQPQYLNDAVNDAVVAAERLVAEAYRNDPHARPEAL